MSPDRDPNRREDEGYDAQEYEVESRRSIFSALWFRALLALLVLGVLAAFAVPYILDFATYQTAKSGEPKRLTSVTPPPVTPVPPTAAPASSSAAPTATPAPPSSTPTPGRARPAAQPPPTAAKPAAPVSTATPASTPATPKAAPASAAKVVDTPREGSKVAAVSKSGAETPARTASAPSASGPYWVQVGAFKDAATATRLATRLREQGLRVEQTTTDKAGQTAAAPSAESQVDRYHVVVSGGAAGNVDAKLAAKGLTSEATAAGAVVQPSLPLREAVALSRELADGGLTVQVRRVGGPVPAVTEGGGATLHRVRVGGFPDRVAALAALKQLEAKGYKPFVARGNE